MGLFARQKEDCYNLKYKFEINCPISISPLLHHLFHILHFRYNLQTDEGVGYGSQLLQVWSSLVPLDCLVPLLALISPVQM